jgi:GNAT superfamily N-acetyltransferase
VFANLQALVARADTLTIAAFSPSGEIEGLLVFRLSAWDTEHFGFPFATIESILTASAGHELQLSVARTLLERFGAWCASERVRFVSTRIPALDLAVIHALEEQGFWFIESWVYNNLDMARVPEVPEPPALRLSVPGDMDVMLEYSTSAFATQRFHADGKFDPAKADSLYRKWIETAFHDPNQLIAVLESDGKPKAFMVYYKSDLRDFVGRQFAMWKMALLDPASRGQGLGTQFFSALARHHAGEGLDVIDSGLSLRNLPSLNLHNKHRFKVVSTIVTFHKWMAK